MGNFKELDYILAKKNYQRPTKQQEKPKNLLPASSGMQLAQMTTNLIVPEKTRKQRADDFSEHIKQNQISEAGKRGAEIFNYENSQKLKELTPSVKKQRFAEETMQKYGVKYSTFDMNKLASWAGKRGYRFVADSSMGHWQPGKNTTEQDKKEFEVLNQVAQNNARIKLSAKDMGLTASALKGFGEGVSLGVGGIVGDRITKNRFTQAGLDEKKYTSLEKANKKTTEKHQISNFAGNVAGSVTSLGGLGKSVSAGLSGVKWFSNAAPWVQQMISSAVTFSASGGVQSAAQGKSVSDILKSAGIGAVGGAAGSALGNAVGSYGEKILWNKGIQNKIIPEIARNALSSSAFAAGNTASTYYLYPKDARPTKEEIAKDFTVAFALGAISSATESIKTSQQNKQILESLQKDISKSYERMTRANSTPGKNGSVNVNTPELAKNVLSYTEAMEAYLRGDGINITINGKAYQQGKGARFIGQEKYVDSILSELQTVKRSANSVLNGVEHNYHAPTISKIESSSAGIKSVSVAESPLTSVQTESAKQPGKMPTITNGTYSPKAKTNAERMDEIHSKWAKKQISGTLQDSMSVNLQTAGRSLLTDNPKHITITQVEKASENAASYLVKHAKENSVHINQSEMQELVLRLTATPQTTLDSTAAHDVAVAISNAMNPEHRQFLERYTSDLPNAIVQDTLNGTLPEGTNAKIKEFTPFQGAVKYYKDTLKAVVNTVSKVQSDIYGQANSSLATQKNLLQKGIYKGVQNIVGNGSSKAAEIETPRSWQEMQTQRHIDKINKQNNAAEKSSFRGDLASEIQAKLSEKPMSSEELSLAIGADIKDVNTELAMLEMDNVQRAPTGIYSLVEPNRTENTVLSAVENSIYPEHKSNTAIFEEEYGGKGFSGLAEQLIDDYKKTGTIGKDEAGYFADRGKAVTDAIAKTVQSDAVENISDRTYESVGSRKVPAFQYAYPQLKPYYLEIAQELIGDVQNTVKGERFQLQDGGYTGTQRLTSPAIESIKQRTGASYEKITDALNRIINDNGQENIALAKRIELVMDDMLTDGYTAFDGTKIPPNMEYITEKNKIESADGALQSSENRDTIVADEGVESGNMYDKLKQLGLSQAEQHAILEYKSSGSYTLNYILRNGEALSAAQTDFKNNLNKALDKFQIYKGIAYRNIGFYGKYAESEFKDFVNVHRKNSVVSYPGFTSASKAIDGYTVNAEYIAHYEIMSENARDVAQIGLTEEQELIFKTNTTFAIEEVITNGNTVQIKLREIVNYDAEKDNRTRENTRNGQIIEGGSQKTKPVEIHDRVHTKHDSIRKGSAGNDRVSEKQSGGDGGGNQNVSDRNSGGSPETVGSIGMAEGRSSRLINFSDLKTPKEEKGRITQDGESKSDELLGNRDKSRKTESNRSESESTRIDKGVFDQSTDIRGGDSAHDPVHSETSGRRKGRTGRRSELQDVGGDTEVRNDSLGERSLLRVNVSDLEGARDVMSSINQGENISLESAKQAAEYLIQNEADIKAELTKLKNDDLKKQLSPMDRAQRTKKAAMVDTIYTDSLEKMYYAISGKDTISYVFDGTSFAERMKNMLREIVNNTDSATFDSILEKNAAKYQERLRKQQAAEDGMKHPKTLEDFRRKKYFQGLSEQETIQFERLYAKTKKQQRAKKKNDKIADTSQMWDFFSDSENYTIEQTRHTKTGADIWVVKPKQRMETEDWKRLNTLMKSFGGSYWRGNGGWNFNQNPEKLISAHSSETVKEAKGAERLRTVADGMQKAIDDKFRDRLTNTAKRAAEAANAEAEGERLKQLQQTLRNIADAIENGDVALIDQIDSRAQVETLLDMLKAGRRIKIEKTLPDISYEQRVEEYQKPYSNEDIKYAKYPLSEVYSNAIADYIRTADGKTGYKQIVERLKKVQKNAQERSIMTNAQMIEDINKIVQNLNPLYTDYWNNGINAQKRLARTGIESVAELRAYLREFIDYLPGRDAEAEKQRKIRQKERELANSKIDGFFPTPKSIVQKMLSEAEIKPDEKVLEPSAGKGNIADEIKENYPDNTLDVVEWNTSLNDLLNEKGHNVVGNDFLQTSGVYDKIVMNPPFEKGQDIDHVKHAYDLLSDGGRVVAVMSEGSFSRNDKKAVDFRNWLDRVGGYSEKLPEGSFKQSERSTGVNTRMVVIDKNADISTETPGVKHSRSLSETAESIREKWKTGKEKQADVSNLSEIIQKISKDFEIPVSAGKVQSKASAGIYKERAEAIRTRLANELPTVSHELGHHLDKRYHLSDLGAIWKLVSKTDPDFLSQYKEKEHPQEAVAEFVRVYLQDQQRAKSLCPDFYKEFRNTISENDLKKIDDLAQQVYIYMSADYDTRFQKSIVSSAEAAKMQKPTLTETGQKLYTDLVDRFHPIKIATDYVKSVKDENLCGADNAYILATNSLDAATIANHVICNEMTNLKGDIHIGKSFIACIQDVKSEDINTFTEYLTAKHALEWIDPKTGVKKKQVFGDLTLENVTALKDKIAKIEAAHPEMITAAKNLYEFQDNILLNFAVPAGLMTADDVQYLRSLYPCYVPFVRALKGKNGQYAKGTFANQRNPVMRAKGDGSMILNPLESIIKNTEKIIKSAERNRVMSVLMDYGEHVDGFGKFLESVPPDQIPHTASTVPQKNRLKQALQEIMGAEDSYALTNLIDEMIGDTAVGFTPFANGKKNIVSVMVKGEKKYCQIHDRALYEAIAELTPQQASNVLDLSAKVMNAMKLLITQNNPMFAASNVIRDIGTAYKMSDINNPAVFTKEYVSALVDVITKSDSYMRYQAMGGGHASELSANIDQISRTLQSVALKDRGLANRMLYGMLFHPIQSVASMNDIAETVPRLMEFKQTEKQGGDSEAAIYNADDITTNFKRAGRLGKNINKGIMFWNAGVQGVDKMRRSFVDVPQSKRNKRIMKYILSAFLVTAIEQFWNRSEDEDGYERLSSYKKNNFYNFSTGDGKFLSLPKARENAVLSSFTGRLVDSFIQQDPGAFYDFGGYLAQQLLPPGTPTSLNPMEALHDVAGSTVFGPIADVGFNEDFKGSPIESKYDQSKPSEERYNDRTTAIAKAMGNTYIIKRTGISPKQIDHLISGYTGVIGQLNKALGQNSKENRDWSLGLKNKFVSDSYYSTDMLNQLYDNKEIAEINYRHKQTAENAVEYEKNATLTSYVSKMMDSIRALPEKQQRQGRAYLFESLKHWNYETTSGQKKIISTIKSDFDDVLLDGLPDSTMKHTINGQPYEYTLKPNEYYSYVQEYLKSVDQKRTEYSVDNMAQAASIAKKQLKEKYWNKYASDHKKKVVK